MKIANFLLVLMLAALCGCTSSNHDDLRKFMDETNRRPPGQIEPLPNFRPYRSFTYGAVGLRSPFELPIVNNEKQYAGNPAVKPDLSRQKEYLESFNIASLTMVGTMSQHNVIWALIQDGDGFVHRVTTGNYLGKNHGRIIETNETAVEVIEIVPDGPERWVERPRTLALQVKD